MHLGDCPKCQARLAVVQRNKYRLVGEDRRILVDENGKDLHQDTNGRLSGKPALEWLVACPDCGRECRDHPHQRTLDEAAARAKMAAPPAPVPESGQTRRHEVNVFDFWERRLTALEQTVAQLREQLATMQETMASQQEDAGRNQTGERGRRRVAQP